MLAFLSCHLMYNIILVSCGHFPLTCNWPKTGLTKRTSRKWSHWHYFSLHHLS